MQMYTYKVSSESSEDVQFRLTKVTERKLHEVRPFVNTLMAPPTL